ncbi:methyltransferase domain-containing protein, partial [Candidatus Woesearchaeota archaeon]|nr:methyltransferase domain-containing protein [Candidatus Woesearchaeota archaeon]
AEVTFLNYGFAPEHEHENISDGLNKYPLGLYRHVVEPVELAGKRVLEVGSGRGGGASYVKEEFGPSHVDAVDLCPNAVSFSQAHHGREGLSFHVGDAMSLDFEDSSHDVVVNVESSHRYPDQASFFAEVRRVLKPGGRFLFTDFRDAEDVEALKDEMTSQGLEVVEERDITPNVVRALELDHDRKERLIRDKVPLLFRRVAREFAGAVGTRIYRDFAEGRRRYLSLVAKPASD